MGDVEPKRRGAEGYPQNVIDQALLAMAYTRQARAAHRQLEMAGVKPLPGESTLRAWRHKYAGRLAELTETHGADIERHIVGGYLDIVTKATEATTVAIDKANEAVERGTDARMITALAGAARNFATIYGITHDKVLLVQGKPTSIIGREKDAEESLRSLADRFSVDSTASSVGDADAQVSETLRVQYPKELES